MKWEYGQNRDNMRDQISALNAMKSAIGDHTGYQRDIDEMERNAWNAQLQANRQAIQDSHADTQRAWNQDQQMRQRDQQFARDQMLRRATLGHLYSGNVPTWTGNMYREYLRGVR